MIVRLLLLVSMAILLAGCGASSTTSATTTTTPSASEPDRLEPIPPFERVQPADSTGYERALVPGMWRLSEVEADDQTILVTVSNGGCLYFSHMTVTDISTTAIALAAWNDRWKPVVANFACTADQRLPQYQIRLPEPLGGRSLEGQCVHGEATIEERLCPDDRFVAPRPRPSPSP